VEDDAEVVAYKASAETLVQRLFTARAGASAETRTRSGKPRTLRTPLDKQAGCM